MDTGRWTSIANSGSWLRGSVTYPKRYLCSYHMGMVKGTIAWNIEYFITMVKHLHSNHNGWHVMVRASCTIRS